MKRFMLMAIACFLVTTTTLSAQQPLRQRMEAVEQKAELAAKSNKDLLSKFTKLKELVQNPAVETQEISTALGYIYIAQLAQDLQQVDYLLAMIEISSNTEFQAPSRTDPDFIRKVVKVVQDQQSFMAWKEAMRKLATFEKPKDFDMIIEQARQRTLDNINKNKAEKID